MPRTDRLFDLITLLRDGRAHRAQDLAAVLTVSPRTIYRDMDRLIAAGVPIEGTRGSGYRARDAITLPPLTLSRAELDALTLGIAIVAEAADPDLAAAARTLEARIEAATPTQALAEAEAWKTAVSPWSDTARGLSHLAILRGAIEGRQKLRLTCRDAGGACQVRTVRPLKLDNWGRVWSLAAWCEEEAGFRDLRLDLIEEAQALPELFLDEPGKRLSDRAP